jgi:hypothetical protein
MICAHASWPAAQSPPAFHPFRLLKTSHTHHTTAKAVMRILPCHRLRACVCSCKNPAKSAAAPTLLVPAGGPAGGPACGGKKGGLFRQFTSPGHRLSPSRCKKAEGRPLSLTLFSGSTPRGGGFPPPRSGAGAGGASRAPPHKGSGREERPPPPAAGPPRSTAVERVARGNERSESETVAHGNERSESETGVGAYVMGIPMGVRLGQDGGHSCAPPQKESRREKASAHGSSTTFPRTWRASIWRCASAAATSGYVCSTISSISCCKIMSITALNDAPYRSGRLATPGK